MVNNLGKLQKCNAEGVAPFAGRHGRRVVPFGAKGASTVPIIGMPAIGVQPIYFHTKAACDAVAAEINLGPEPNVNTPKEKQKSFGAVCRSTGVQ